VTGTRLSVNVLDSGVAPGSCGLALLAPVGPTQSCPPIHRLFPYPAEPGRLIPEPTRVVAPATVPKPIGFGTIAMTRRHASHRRTKTRVETRSGRSTLGLGFRYDREAGV